MWHSSLPGAHYRGGILHPKDRVKIIINSLRALLILFLVKALNIMEYAGKPEIEYNTMDIMLCVPGGIPGALIVIIMQVDWLSGPDKL
jgi:hypothetical protein